MTPEQIRTRGLTALKRELGVAGMVRFLQQFDQGKGNWSEERRAWVDKLTMDDLGKLMARERQPRRKKQK